MAQWKWENGNIKVNLTETDHKRVKLQVTPIQTKMKKIPDRQFYNTTKVSYYKTRAELLLYPEYIFAYVFKLKVNTCIYEFGDPGYDFIVKKHKIEVRTAPWIQGYFPIRDNIHSLKYDIGVLIANPLEYYDKNRKISFDETLIVGYFTKNDINHAVLRYDQGKENWVMYQRYLRPIEELYNWRFNNNNETLC